MVHDEDALRTRTAGEWKALLQARRSGSGVWTWREWVLPEITDEDIVSTGEGRTPLVEAARLGREWGMRLWVKQCGTSHTGSFKDLGMTVLVSAVRRGIRAGDLDVRAIGCASTGDTSAALAAYGALAEIPVCVLLPKGRVSTAQLVQPLAHGARVIVLDTDFDGCMRIMRELARRGLLYLANSMNPLRIEGQKTVAFEIAEAMGWDVPEWVVLPSGNLGNSAALHAGFSLLLGLGLTQRMPRLCVAQAERANPMYRAWQSGARTVAPVAPGHTLASAIQIGAPVSAPRALRALAEMNGVVEQATEEELADACALADRAGLYTCPQTGVALACARKLRARGVIAGSHRVVVVATAHGLKFTEQKLGYHQGTLELGGTPALHRNVPVELPADVERVADVVLAPSRELTR